MDKRRTQKTPVQAFERFDDNISPHMMLYSYNSDLNHLDVGVFHIKVGFILFTIFDQFWRAISIRQI